MQQLWPQCASATSNFSTDFMSWTSPAMMSSWAFRGYDSTIPMLTGARTPCASSTSPPRLSYTAQLAPLLPVQQQKCSQTLTPPIQLPTSLAQTPIGSRSCKRYSTSSRSLQRCHRSAPSNTELTSSPAPRFPISASTDSARHRKKSPSVRLLHFWAKATSAPAYHPMPAVCSSCPSPTAPFACAQTTDQ